LNIYLFIYVYVRACARVSVTTFRKKFENECDICIPTSTESDNFSERFSVLYTCLLF